jgi:flagellar basal-body rod protein FlgG
MPDGNTAYTRAGSFQLNAEGTVVTSDGYTVQPGIVVPADAVDITVNGSGEVQVKLDGQIQPQTVGQIQLAVFANDAGLEAIGSNLLLATPASGDAVPGNPSAPGYGRLVQGALETSNVNIVAEITNLITAQRAYEMNSKVISTTDQMMTTTSQLR